MLHVLAVLKVDVLRIVSVLAVFQGSVLRILPDSQYFGFATVDTPYTYFKYFGVLYCGCCEYCKYFVRWYCECREKSHYEQYCVPEYSQIYAQYTRV